MPASRPNSAGVETVRGRKSSAWAVVVSRSAPASSTRLRSAPVRSTNVAAASNGPTLQGWRRTNANTAASAAGEAWASAQRCDRRAIPVDHLRCRRRVDQIAGEHARLFLQIGAVAIHWRRRRTRCGRKMQNVIDPRADQGLHPRGENEHACTEGVLVVGTALVLVSIATGARAQGTLDHLECRRAKDDLRISATLDLEAITTRYSARGCRIGRVNRLCVPVTKTNVQPPPPGAVAGQTLDGAYLCYRLKCRVPRTGEFLGISSGFTGPKCDKRPSCVSPRARRRPPRRTTSTTTSSSATTTTLCGNPGSRAAQPGRVARPVTRSVGPATATYAASSAHSVATDRHRASAFPSRSHRRHVHRNPRG